MQACRNGPLCEYKEKDNTPFAEVIRENGSVCMVIYIFEFIISPIAIGHTPK